jgi:OOP family OmpA-OmpF porin
MVARRTLSTAAVVIALATIAAGQAPPPAPGVTFPPPSSSPEAVADSQDFPFIPALPGARLIATKRIEAPLELRSATAADEAVLAGMSYIQKSYEPPGSLTATAFVSVLRDALFAAGWKLIDVTRLEEISVQPETVNVAASYLANDRIIFARVSQEPGGPYQVNVADVGAEDWAAALGKECRIRVPSIQFDLDRPTFRPESAATLEKLARVLKPRSGPVVEVQGHSDNIGPAGDAARQALSEARAKAVAGWLADHGVPQSKLSSAGYGKTRPVAANDSDLGRATNRRIEIVRKDCSR